MTQGNCKLSDKIMFKSRKNKGNNFTITIIQHKSLDMIVPTIYVKTNIFAQSLGPKNSEIGQLY